ncbi:RNA polymerase sigma-70 factor, ECF subfamily [bacterium A37T11]|nr:RNA polymerase sigma-70 factor, ECF subfamily [bacterium A37T11]
MDVFTSDEELLTSFRQGDEKAFSMVYHQHAGVLIDYAASRLESFDEAKDMIHDLFIQLWEARENLQLKHSFKAFLFFCLKRRILNYYRQHNSRSVYAERLKVLASSFSPGADTYVEAKEVKELLDNTLENMSGRVREIYLMSREEYLSNKEIALKLNLSEQTVKNQLYTATLILKEKFRAAGLLSLALLCSMLA